MVRKIFKFIFSLLKSQWIFFKEKGYLTLLLMYFSMVATMLYAHYSFFKSGRYVPVGALRGCEDGINILHEENEETENKLYQCITVLTECANELEKER